MNRLASWAFFGLVLIAANPAFALCDKDLSLRSDTCRAFDARESKIIYQAEHDPDWCLGNVKPHENGCTMDEGTAEREALNEVQGRYNALPWKVINETVSGVYEDHFSHNGSNDSTRVRYIDIKRIYEDTASLLDGECRSARVHAQESYNADRCLNLALANCLEKNLWAKWFPADSFFPNPYRALYNMSHPADVQSCR